MSSNIYRESGSKTVDDILDGVIDTTTGTGKVTKNYTKPGSYQAELEDFNSLGFKNVKESSNGALVGQLDDGTYVNYRLSDENGWSLEIQYGSRNKVKIRYE